MKQRNPAVALQARAELMMSARFALAGDTAAGGAFFQQSACGYVRAARIQSTGAAHRSSKRIRDVTEPRLWSIFPSRRLPRSGTFCLLDSMLRREEDTDHGGSFVGQLLFQYEKKLTFIACGYPLRLLPSQADCEPLPRRRTSYWTSGLSPQVVLHGVEIGEYQLRGRPISAIDCHRAPDPSGKRVSGNPLRQSAE